MVKQVTLTNVKGISELIFDVPLPGVHLLAGTNGVGKTSLLACLLRIGYSSAFLTYFPTSKLDKKLDDFRDCAISYSIDEKSVTYVYGGERWVPQPRKESGLLKDFGYPDVIYVGANASRVSPRSEDFNLKKLKPAKGAIRDAANQIFETGKFDTLKETNVKQGVTPAFVLQITMKNGAVRYVSEKNLSLGELCILKLLRRIEDCKNGSLVLIDEVELALHPRAQLGLYSFLEKITALKGLTVLVSSHSVTLLKTVRRKNIIFMEREGDKVKTITGCFPAYALREVAHKEERTPDVVIYVEDEAAQTICDALCRLVLMTKYMNQVPPSIQVIPIGGYENVIKFLENSSALLPAAIKRAAILDADAQAELEKANMSGSRTELIAIMAKNKGNIRYLEWTPEVGLSLFLQSSASRVQKELRTKFLNQQITISFAPSQLTTMAEGGEKRAKCKSYVKQVLQEVCAELPHRSTEEIQRVLYTLWMESYFKTNQSAAMQLLAPLL